VKLINVFQITKTNHSASILSAGILLAIFGIGLFVVGFDQGQLFSIIQGEPAFSDLYLHEFTHDMRHAAGFPCH
jgi:hypothetical protein